MASISVTYSFTNSTTADAGQMNTNFTDIINGTSDGSKDFSISALTCAGNVTFNGNTTVGNASSDDFTLTASLASSIPIKTHNTYDFGSVTSKGLRYIYFASSSATNTARLAGPAVSSDINIVLPATAGTLALDQDTSAQVFNARLTLTTATPVTTTDVTAATTVYLTPYCGNKIGLYDGSRWNLHTLTEISIAVPATTATMYDLFVYDNAGTLTLEAVAWTNDTTRATAIAQQNGVDVKTGTLTKRLCGSFRTTASSGQTEDSRTRRYLSNRYNRKLRNMSAIEATDSWTYTSLTWRAANGDSAANCLDFVNCVDEGSVNARVAGSCSNASANLLVQVGVGVDTSGANSAQICPHLETQSSNTKIVPWAAYNGHVGPGRHQLIWIERSSASGTTTWLGDNGEPMGRQSGIIGEMWG